MKAVIIFTKYPRKGNVKTRLAKTLGYNFATEFFKLTAENIFKVCLSLPAKKISLFLFYGGKDGKTEIINWVDTRFSLNQQEGKDLGEKMKNAFELLFNKRYKNVIIIGTDCPDLNEEILLKSFEELSEKNIVIGPSNDGGYYLLGMDNFYPYLFDNIKWSRKTVFEETIKTIKKNGLAFNILPELKDIDTEKDLREWLSGTNEENELTRLIDQFGIR